MTGHPQLEELAGAAAGDAAARARLAPHLSACPACREELARMLGLLEAAAEEWIEARPGCPPPEELAEIPPGAERDHPHLQACPLCREELALIRRFQTARRLETAFETAGPHRPELTVESELPLAAAAPGARIELELREGASIRGTAGGVQARLEVAAGQLVVELAGAPEGPLEIVLENELLERRVRLQPGRTVVPVESWRRASLRPARGGT